MNGFFSSLKSLFCLFRKKENSIKGVLSPRGMVVVASTREEKEPLNFFGNTILEVKEVGKPYILFKLCDHIGSRKYQYNIWGQQGKFTLKGQHIKKENGQLTVNSRCPKCVLERSIRCCLCGSAILPGDPVSLYHKKSAGINQAVATFVNDSVVGCMLWDCCPSGGFFAGHWTENGFKSAFNTGNTVVEESAKTGQIISGNI